MEVVKGSDGVYDFDAIATEPRYVRVGGEKIDVSVIPVAVSLVMAKLSDRTPAEIQEIATKDPMGEFNRMVQLLSDVCIQSNPKVTPEFLKASLNSAKLIQLFKFVFEPTRRAAGEEAEGEAGAASPE